MSPTDERTLLLRRLPRSFLATPKRLPRLAGEPAIEPRQPYPPHVERLPLALRRVDQHERQADVDHFQRRRFVARHASNAHQLVARMERIVVVPVPRRPLADDVQRRHKIAAADLLRRQRLRQRAGVALRRSFRSIGTTAHAKQTMAAAKKFAQRLAGVDEKLASDAFRAAG